MRYLVFLLLFIPTVALANDPLIKIEDEALAACELVIRDRNAYYIKDRARCDDFKSDVTRRRVNEKFNRAKQQLDALETKKNSKHIKEIIDYFK